MLSLLESLDVKSWAIPLVSIALTYTLGVLSTKRSERRTSDMLRYETLYVPAMKQLLESHCWESTPTSHFGKYIDLFQNIIMKNPHLLGIQTAKKLPNCLIAQNVLIMSEDHIRSQYTVYYELPYSIGDIDFDKAMNDFTVALLQEAQSLSNKLKLPDLPSTILKFYYQQKRDYQL